MIVVTGATGQVGGAVARALASRGVPFRMLVRDTARAPELPGAVAVEGTYEDAAALDAALEPGDRVFMVSMFAAPDERMLLHRSFVDACNRRQVDRVLYLSFVDARADAGFRHARTHGATEELLRASDLSWGAVRNAMYGDALPDWFDDDGRITGPGGDGRVSFTMIDELAEAIAVLLAEPALDDRERVTVTTPDSIDLAGLAALAAALTGDDYRYEPVAREAWKAFRRTRGRAEWSIEAGLSFYDSVAAGEVDIVGDDYARVTGREPRTIRQVVELCAARLPLSRKERT